MYESHEDITTHTPDIRVTAVLRADDEGMDHMSNVHDYCIRGQRTNRLYISGQELQHIQRFTSRLKALKMAEIFGTEDHHNIDGSFVYMFTEIFSLDALYTAHKMSVLLNVMDSGLFYNASNNLTRDQSYILASLIALGAGDVTPLLTNGRSLSGLPQEVVPKYGWTRRPINGDRVFVPPAIARTPMDVKVTAQGLQIDTVFLPMDHSPVMPDPRYQRIADILIDHTAMNSAPILESLIWMEYDDDGGAHGHAYENNEEVCNQVRLHFIHKLACMLQRGKTWIKAVSPRHSSRWHPWPCRT